MKIESQDQDIRTLLSSGYYKVPRFQRPYSWDRENIQDFWNDIVQDGAVDYFIGSMVVYKDGNQRYGVVDGQQRLTTITILLCVVRNALAALGHDDLAQGVHGLIERKNIDNKPEYIVSHESSSPYFQDRIQSLVPGTLDVTILKEELSLQGAFDQFTHLVDERLEAARREDSGLPGRSAASRAQQALTAIRDTLLNLTLILVKLEDEDAAYVIFETLNTRGKDLRLKDLVKNHLAKLLKSRSAGPDTTRVKWEQMVETIEGSSAELDQDTFIHHFWLSRYDYLPIKTLFKTLKQQVNQRRASAFLDDLVSDADLYRQAHERGYAKWSKEERRIERALTALTIFRVQQQAPCVLSLLREYKTTRKLQKKHVEDALVAIEKFHFLFTAVTTQRSSGGISAMYAALARRLHDASTRAEAVKVLRDLLQKLRTRVPSYTEFEALFSKIIFTEGVTKQKRLVKYVLSCLDSQVDSSTVTDYEQMTIEHIAPQQLIGQSNYSDAVVGQLGNLILVSSEINHKLRNRGFAEKKKLLMEARFRMPHEMASATTWGATQIEHRTRILARQAYTKVWRI